MAAADGTLAMLSYPEKARQSCLAFFADLERAQSVPARPCSAAAKVFAATLDVEKVRAAGSSLASDANATRASRPFASVDEEAGLIVLMHALDFGGGWRQELHAFHGKGAWQTVKPGVEALHQSQPSLPTAWLAALSEADVAEHFCLPSPAAGSTSPSPLAPFVSGLTNVCNELGAVLSARGFETLSSWLASRLEANHSAAEGPAASLVRDLVDSFPCTFDDRYILLGQPVFIYKKAQLVVGELFHRFRGEDSRFAFPDGDNLTAFIDNVICAVLRQHGVVTVTDELAAAIEGHLPLRSGSCEEVSLRAAAMVGVEEIVQAVRASGGRLSSSELGNYLWGVLGKVPSSRSFTRHATKDTVFY